MQTTVGIFLSRATAERAATELRDVGIAEDQLSMLTPLDAGEQHDSAPTTASEPSGVGKALGGVVGGALGASSGVFGTAIAVSMIPGIGPVLGGGLGLAALLGAVGGATAGAVAGGALETRMSQGVPIDELWVYDSALKQGRTVIIVLADNSTQCELARCIFEDAGAESIDAARRQWSVGLLDAEALQYRDGEAQVKASSQAYQKGFEAALQPEVSNRSHEMAQTELQRLYADLYHHPDFRHGYEQGRSYGEHIQEKWRQAIFDKP